MESIAPSGNSTQYSAQIYMLLKRQGFRQEIVLIILLFLSTKIASIGKCIKKVCMELHGLNKRASPGLSSFLAKRPFSLLKKVSAMAACSAKTISLVLLIIFTGGGWA